MVLAQFDKSMPDRTSLYIWRHRAMVPVSGVSDVCNPFTSMLTFGSPLFGMPIGWTLGNATDTASMTNPASFSIPVQLDPRTAYVAFILDSTNDGEYDVLGNAKPLQIMSSTADSSCMSSVVKGSQQFFYSVGGTTDQCGTFSVYYDDAIGYGPYYMTVIPLDGTFHPYDIAIGNDTEGESVQSSHALTLSNALGYGNGGIGGIYQVAAGTASSCLSDAFNPTSAWPDGATTVSVGPLTTSVPLVAGVRSSQTHALASTTPFSPAPSQSSSSSTNASASSTSESRRIGTNVALIAGAAGGGAAGVIVLGLLVFLCMRRRRRALAPVDPIDLCPEPTGVQEIKHVPTGYYTAFGPTVTPYTPLPTDATSPAWSTLATQSPPLSQSQPLSYFPVATSSTGSSKGARESMHSASQPDTARHANLASGSGRSQLASPETANEPASMPFRHVDGGRAEDIPDPTDGELPPLYADHR
ncbi:hypothetical protein IAU60_006878 [Kwoniella sp. DSM 27419]